MKGRETLHRKKTKYKSIRALCKIIEQQHWRHTLRSHGKLDPDNVRQAGMCYKSHAKEAISHYIITKGLNSKQKQDIQNVIRAYGESVTPLLRYSACKNTWEKIKYTSANNKVCIQ